MITNLGIRTCSNSTSKSRPRTEFIPAHSLSEGSLIHPQLGSNLRSRMLSLSRSPAALPIMDEENDLSTYYQHALTTSMLNPSMYSTTTGYPQQQQQMAAGPSIVPAAYYQEPHTNISNYNPMQYWPPVPQTAPPQYSVPQYAVPSVVIVQPQLAQSASSSYYDQSCGVSRSPSASSASGYTLGPSDDFSQTRFARSVSPGTADLRAYGYWNDNGSWTCAYPGCTSRAVFTRGCDLRKHHKRHTKSYFCEYEGCAQSSGGGFSSKKDLARHMASHQPNITCDWEGCDRVFSRVDNMRDHVKRIHTKRPPSDST